MSCHDIGRGMNSVVEKVMELLESNKISKEAAKEIIIACRKGVHWCDGNEGEAVECILYSYCGNCLERIPAGQPLYSVEDVSSNVPDRHNISDKFNLAFWRLCDECFRKIINQICGDEKAAEKEIDYIKSRFGDDEDYKYIYESEG